MKLKNILVLHTLIALLFGFGSVIVPNRFMSLFGAELNPPGVLMMRYGGAWLIGIGVLAWLARNTVEADSQRRLAVAMLTMSVIASIVAVAGQIAGVLNVLGWLPVAINLLLSLAYGYCLFDIADVTQPTTPMRQT